MLTCYSPVRHSLFISIATEWSAFDLHVLGTPPAFVLSQDQTLHRDSRPAKSPRKRQFDQPRIRESPCSDSMHDNNRPEPFTRFQSLLTSLFDSQPFPFPANRSREDCPHWLLALTISFSRSDRAHTDQAGVGAGCPKGLFQTHCELLESLLRAPEDREGPFRRACHLIRCLPERQRVQARTKPPRGGPLASMVAAPVRTAADGKEGH